MMKVKSMRQKSQKESKRESVARLTMKMLLVKLQPASQARKERRSGEPNMKRDKREVHLISISS